MDFVSVLTSLWWARASKLHLPFSFRLLGARSRPSRTIPPQPLSSAAMLHYFKFRQELAGPVAARDVYVKRVAGKGWPEECPPVRAANAFGFDLLANFDVTFVQKRGVAGGWRV